MATERFVFELGGTSRPQALTLVDGTALLTAPGDGFVLVCEKISTPFENSGSPERRTGVLACPGRARTPVLHEEPEARLKREKPAPRRVRLERLVPQADGRLLATTDDGTHGIVLDAKETGKYIAFRIVELRGVDTRVFSQLDFSLNAKPEVRVMELDTMTLAHNHDHGVSVSWPYLKHSGDDNPYGGFALYVADSPDDEDDTILRIWAGENLPHPRVDGPWDLAAARRLVEEWQTRYADQSQFYLAAQTPEELYEGVPYAERAGVKDIYLFTDTWHGSERLNWGVNKKVFPRGEADLLAFSDYLENKGMHLKLHWFSGGISKSDPRYVLPKPDRRLASWVSGRLVEPVDAKETTLLFSPDHGFEKPPEGGVWARGGGPPPYIRIEDELIQVGSFENMDQPSHEATARQGTEVWKLRDCRRGFSGTSVSAHAAGAELVVLVAPYNSCFTPDVNSTLLDEMAEGYAGLVNRCGIMNVEFDGFEFHGYAGRWGCETFAAKVYAALDHPVASNTSGGRPPYCWIEYRLNSTKEIMRGNKASTHGGYSAPIMLDAPERPASRVSEAHFSMSKAAANDANRFSVTKPQPMFGVSPGVIEQHGRADEIIGLVRQWKEASMHMTDEQRRIMRSVFEPAERLLSDSSREPCSAVVWTLRDTPEAPPSQEGSGAASWNIVPVRVLTREEGDIKWHSWQEHGPIMPRQYIKAGQSLRLINPNPPQTPHFIIQCLSAFDPEEPTTEVDPAALNGLQWVWNTADADTAPNSAPAATIHLRKVFELPPDFTGGRARFLFAVDDELELWINGVRVNRGGTFTQMTAWDVTRHLKPGQNVIAVAATSFAGPAGVAGKIEVVTARTAAEQAQAEHVAAFEGKAAADSFEVPLDVSWRCTAAPPGGWQQPGFDAADWGTAVPLVEVGGSPWGDVGAAVIGSLPLQPAASDMQETGEMQFADDGDGLRITCDNTAAERRTFEDALPYFERRVVMTSHRGIGLEVTGDGSGALLVVRIPGRDYVVPIDFTGRRYVEIPKGEVSWADGRWGWRTATHHANYGGVARVHLGFGAVPGKTRVRVVVHSLRALRELSTQLKDPVVQIGQQGVLRCQGSVQTSEYLEYTGGTTARVFDCNWNFLRELPVESRDFVMPTGEETVTISGTDGAPAPWLDVQIMTDGDPIVVPKPKKPEPIPPRYSGLRQ